MSYTFEIEETGDYIKVDIIGEFVPGKELEDSVNVWAEVLNSCQGKSSNRILATWKVPGYLPTMAAYNLAEAGEELGWDKNFKLAVVHISEQRYQDGIIAETFAADHGFNVKMFLDAEEAKKWLLEK